MWSWAADLSRARKARLAVEGTIAPLVERSRLRLGSIPDATWSDPYIVGFIVMLITILARMEVGKINSETLCQVQTKAWEDITGRTGLIGEEVLLLSTANNRSFENGCRNAVQFSSVLVSHSVLFGNSNDEERYSLDLRTGHPNTSLIERPDILAMWEKYFDTWLPVDHSNDMLSLQ